MNHSFSVLPHSFVIAQLERDADLPNTVLTSPGFMSITRTDDELSIVCAEGAATGLARVDSGWRAIKVQVRSPLIRQVSWPPSLTPSRLQLSAFSR